MDKREKTERQRQEDIALHKILYWMFGAAVLVFLLRWMDRNYVNHDGTYGSSLFAWQLGQIIPIAFALGVLLTAAATWWALRGKRAGKKGLLPFALSGFFLGVTLCVLAAWMFAGVGIQLMTYLVIGLGVLAVIYYLYQRDFVAVGFACALALIGLWLYFREGGTLRVYLAFTLALVALVAVALFARHLQKNAGACTYKGEKCELLPKGTCYPLIYVTCGLMAVVLAAALLTGGVLSHMIYYAVPVAWLLISAVYYTVKLM